MPLPPGNTSFPPALPPSMRRSFTVANRRAADGKFDVRGPFSGVLIPVSGTLQIEQFGQLISVEYRIHLPPESAVKARAIIRDIASNIAYEVSYVRPLATKIEAYVSRAQGGDS